MNRNYDRVADVVGLISGLVTLSSQPSAVRHHSTHKPFRKHLRMN